MTRMLIVAHMLALMAACVDDEGVKSNPTNPTNPTNPNDPNDPNDPNNPTFPASGAYASLYRVPSEQGLSAAAVFAVAHVDWTIVGDALTLHYELPVGLVGGLLDVTFVGTVDNSGTIEIAGANGTGSCTMNGSIVVCREMFLNLGPLPISMEVVTQSAAAEYSGPAEHRRAIATLFGSDPIGFVEIDASRPVIDDHGGGGGGGGNGNGDD